MTKLELTKAKIYNRASLVTVVEKWQQAGDIIVFTNGCFDIMHLGHVDYLAKAADLGNRLVIGVNTDASVSTIKGPSRPITNETSRTMLLAALHFVDAVVLFHEETPKELIEAVRPNVLVKGADYIKENIVGYDFVVARGGKVETIQFLDGYSTTSIVNKIKTT